jgi:hypothetical protein
MSLSLASDDDTFYVDVAARLDEASTDGLGSFSQMGCGATCLDARVFSTMRTNDVDL